MIRRGAWTLVVLMSGAHAQGAAGSQECPQTSCARGELVLVYDGRTEAIEPPTRLRYDTDPVVVCIDNPNYAVKYQVTSTSVALPALPSNPLEQLPALAPSPGSRAGGGGKESVTLVAAGKLASNEIIEAQTLRIWLTDARFRDAAAHAILTEETIQKAVKSAFSKQAAKFKVQAANVAKKDQAALKEDLKDADIGVTILSAVTSDPPARAAFRKSLLDRAATAPAADPLEDARKAVKQANDDVQPELLVLNNPYVPGDEYCRMLAKVTDSVAAVEDARRTLASSSDTQDATFVETATRLLNTVATLRGHAASLRGGSLRYPIPLDADKITTIVVSGRRAKKRDNAGSGPEPIVDFGDVKELARATVEVHSLTYVKLGLGVVWTSLSNPTFSTGNNDLGAQTIQATRDNEIVPLLILSHYWYGADLRATQPWDRNRPYWAVNMLPTLAFGIPLSKSPLENFFLGAQIQPVPGLALLVGGHVGRVSSLRSGFAVGAAPPMPSEGFRIDDAVEHKFKSGYFIGVNLSDTLFIKVILALVGGPKQ